MAMEWTDELIARLKELWGQGLSTAEIGRQLSITKNAVVGKAHRLALPPRPSPIRNKAAANAAGKPAARSRTTPRGKKSETAPEALRKGEKAAKAPVAAASTGEKAETKGKAGTAAAPSGSASKAKPAKVEKPTKVKVKEAAPKKEAAKPSTRKESAAKSAEKAEPASPSAGHSVTPPRKVAPPRRVREAMDRPARQGPTCQWPIGDPGTPDFHFCGATPLPGKPYCAEHAAVAYVKIRDRRH